MSLKGSDALLQSPGDKRQITFRAEHSEVPSHFHSCIIRFTCSARERPPSSWCTWCRKRFETGKPRIRSGPYTPYSHGVVRVRAVSRTLPFAAQAHEDPL